jgi:hypothetical protein
LYTTEWALSFDGFTKDEPMDLHKSVLFYKEHIADRAFHFVTRNKEMPSFIVDSRLDQLPHLLGLAHWNNLHIRQSSKQLELLLSGEWDMEYLANADQGSFKEYRDRIESLPYLYGMLYKGICDIKPVHPVMPSPFKNRKINMIFQREGSKLAHVLELREKKEAGDNRIFAPTSLTVYRKNARELQIKTNKIIVDTIEIIN